jgi:hypothetical protein
MGPHFQEDGMFDWETQFAAGLKGESLARKYLEGRGYTITKDDRLDRYRGIDFVGQKGEHRSTFQVKTETYQNGNIAFELWSKLRQRIPGGHLTTQAMFIIHMLPRGLVVLSKRILREKEHEVIQNLPCKVVPNLGYYSIIIPVPIDRLRDLNIIVHEEHDEPPR